MMTCKIEGCIKPVRTRGWCTAHYNRWQRHGDPLGGQIAQGEAQRFYREVVLPYDGTDCLFWPYATIGRGYACMDPRDGKSRYVHRRLCEEVHGPAPSPDHEAAHSCGKGHEACVTKGHLSWKTPAGNHADKLIHDTHNRGERHGLSKVTEAEARAILALKDKKTQREIAADFSVSQSIVARIHQRETWAWL
jgi:hypothetical protein